MLQLHFYSRKSKSLHWEFISEWSVCCGSTPYWPQFMYVKSNPCPYFLHNKRTSKRGNQVQHLHIERQCPSNRSLNHPSGARRINHSLSKKRASSEMAETFRMVGELYHLPSNKIQASRLCSDVHYRTWARQQASNLHCIMIMKTTQTYRLRRREASQNLAFVTRIFATIAIFTSFDRVVMSS